MILTVVYTNEVLPDGKIKIRNAQTVKGVIRAYDEIVSDNPMEIFSFLATNYGDLETRNHKWTWDLNGFYAPILRLLPVEVCKELVREPDNEALISFDDNGKITVLDIKNKTALAPNMFSLVYRRNTSFIIEAKGQYKSYFYHLQQFHETVEPITDLNVIVAKQQEFVDACFALGWTPLKCSSMAGIFEQAVLNHIKIPTMSDLPLNLTEDECTEIATWAEDMMGRDLRSNLAVGHWNENEANYYDMRSAFGYFLSETYDYKYAKIVKSNSPIKEATNGLLKGTVTINDNVRFSPIAHVDSNGKLTNPNGTWNTVLTLSEVRFIYKYKIGSFKLDYGYFITQTAPVQPFKETLKRLYSYRAKGGMVNSLAKRAISSAWSKMIQKANGKDGNPHYSPLTALSVKTECRLAVAAFIYDHHLENDVIFLATDGFLSEKKIEIPEKTGMGDWRMEAPTPCVILSPNRLYRGEKKPNSINLVELERMIKENPNEIYYKTSVIRPLTLGESLKMNDLSLVGKIAEVPTGVDIINAREYEQSFEFNDFPSCGQDLITNKYYGKPLSVKE